jgi:hypothetical protein
MITAGFRIFKEKTELPRKRFLSLKQLAIVFQYKSFVFHASVYPFKFYFYYSSYYLKETDNNDSRSHFEAWQSKQKDASFVYFFGGSKTIPIKLIFWERIPKMFIYNPWKCRWDIPSRSGHMN